MVPATLPRFVRLPGEAARYVAIETVIRRQIADLFPGYELLGGGAFRIIRDSDIEIEEEAEDLVRFYRTALKRRRRGRVIRLKLEEDIPDALEALVREGLDASEALVYESTGFLGIADLDALVEEDRPDLKFPPFTPRFPERIREYGGDCFAAIRAKDIVVHHPYESFDVVLAFLRQAAADPGRRRDQADALPRRQAVGGDQRADRRRRGGQVGHRGGRAEGALRGGAESDVGERAGARRRPGRLRLHRVEDPRQDVDGRAPRGGQLPHLLPPRHRQLSPGHRAHLHRSELLHRRPAGRAATSPTSSTTSPAISSRAGSSWSRCRRTICATSSCALIDAEIANARAGKAGGHLGEDELAGRCGDHRQALRSEPGRRRDRPLIRGICCLRPGVPGLPRISASSRSSAASSSTAGSGASAMATRCPIARPRSTSSSADWMPRNFDRRVEYALPIENDTVHAQILDQVMVANIIDNEQSWRLNADGSYTRLAPGAGREAVQPPPLFHDQPVAVRAAAPRLRTSGATPRKLTIPRGRTKAAMFAEQPVAIIDIGSNSVRLVVYSGADADPLGHLQREGAGRARPRASARPARWRRRRGRWPRSTASACWSGRWAWSRTRTVATAAVREASNGAAFLDAGPPRSASSRASCPARKRAKRAGQGVLSAIPDADGIVGDLGGGSLELVDVAGGQVGAQRLAAARRAAPRRACREEARHASPRRSPRRSPAPASTGAAAGRPFYLVGGSWRTLARLDMALDRSSAADHPPACDADRAGRAELATALAKIDKATLRDIRSVSLVALSDPAQCDAAARGAGRRARARPS